MKKQTARTICLSLLVIAFIACKKDGNKEKTISITPVKDISGSYTLKIERKEGTGSEYITSQNPSIVNHEMELAVSKDQENSYKVELREFSIQMRAPICTFVYNTRMDTTGNTKGPFGAITFKKEKQEQLNRLLEHYKKLRGSSFIFKREVNGVFRSTSGGITWDDYKNNLKMRTEDPEAELKKYINPDYLAAILNETFNDAEGDFTLNNPIEKQGTKLQLNPGKSPEEYELFKQTRETGRITTVRTTWKGTKSQWQNSVIINTRLSPHRINGINNISVTTTQIQKSK